MKPYILVLLCTIFLHTSLNAQSTNLITGGSSWRYFNSAVAPPAGWTSALFDDATWSAGNTEAGYGDGGEATVLVYGPNANSKYISYYFRKSFSVINPATITSLAVLLLRDDGAIVYLNGTEVVRSNMPAGAILFGTLASSAITGANESAWNSFTVPASALVSGTNVIAVEIHQSDPSSSDLSFNFSLTSSSVCGVPTGLTTTALSATGATFNWTTVAGAVSYVIQYKKQSVSTWTTLTSLTNSKPVTGLSANTAYDFKVQSVCNAGSSGYSSVKSFSTPATPPASITDTLINSSTSWKYLDNGSNQGTAWRMQGFSDAIWASGNAQLGYGDGDEATIVGFGPSTTNRYITTYFRKTFALSTSASYNILKMNLLRDDGAVVYLNGAEIYRINMPSGTIGHATLAPVGISGTGESAWYSADLDPALLLTGTNTVAVEIHQNSASSSDISFNMRLIATQVSAATLVRGPYLNVVGSNRITIRWKTDVPAKSRVKYGTTQSYGLTKDDQVLTKDHEVTLTGLSPNTTYYYTIGSLTQQLQGEAANKFITAPVTGSTAPVRIWATGDFGNGSTAQANVRNAFQEYNRSRTVNLWLWMGDNAYETGTDAEFQAKVFNVYPAQFKSIPVYPSIGNHDYADCGYQSTQALTTNFPYYSMFTMPTAGETGGVPSGTEKYYSYNYGNIHFVVLDSYGALNTAGSPMYNWLESDLAANTQRWTICYWHHPPYSHGSHNSDSDGQLINIRQNIVPLLESYHVDMVLCGHSHYNERSYFIRNHLSTSGSFTNSMKVSTSSNRFVKSSISDGCVYVVCGTSGQAPYPSTIGAMPCMAYSNGTQNCSLVIDIAGDSLNCCFLAATGAIADEFSIVKQTAPARLAGSPFVASRIHPNPAHEFAVIETELPAGFFSKEDEVVMQLQVTDLSGREIMKQNVDAIYAGDGFARFAIRCINIPTGIYMYRLVSLDAAFPVQSFGKFFVE